ncbi:tripartite tricarboxylate transporter substrate binding protein [Pseudooceanicola nanhaiensis]|uniref:tripartite tricarboxylate transporter substrate binding protein n=1 Tax=Pseudooceanicola nanhaiensis TaxID=375761 RepID=UPI001CD6B79B|nr:tripartite tricarboxylate transporter substrate binding protein [Pseudooceanicola nanhaiensis]MCA0922484.1 tripartite tricarboxylate transporter substrate binding protein [Pseudooceanicola nanhaiensis]
MTFAKGLFTTLTGAALLAASTLTAAAQDFPTKDITHIMPWSAGGGTDTVMRTFLQYAEKPLGVGIRTQNVTGAQSGVGTMRLMKSRPDGYTIGSLTWDSMITVPYKNLVPGYDTSTLSYLANVTLYPTVLAVNADTGWETLDDFIAAAKAEPGEVTVSDSGIGGIWHLHALDMAEQLGVELNHVPFPNGSAEQREALISGENDAASLSYATVSSAAEAGQVKVLAVMGSERDPSLPDVPTFKELGYDVIWGGMRVLAVPADTPDEVKVKLTEGFKAAFDDPEFQQKAADTGMNAYWMDGPETEAYVERTQTRALALLDKLKAAGVLE